VFPSLLEEKLVVSVHLFKADKAVTDAKNATLENTLRGGGPMPAPSTQALVLAELYSRDGTDGVRAKLLDGDQAHGAPVDIVRAGTYDLMVVLTSKRRH
jgi:hypothetical protein